MPPGFRESRQTFLVLDGLRGVAAIVVVLWHAEPLLGFIPQSGYLAVDLFFGLSGFVLAYAYDGKFAGGMNSREFMRIRLIRLYPLFVLGVAIVTATICVNLYLGQYTHWTAGRLLASTLFSIGFLPSPPELSYNHILYPLNSPAWSLAFELLINWAFVFAWPWLTFRVLSAIAAIAAVMLTIISIRGGSLDVGWGWGNWHGGIPRVLYSFTMGVLLLRAFRQKQMRIPVGPALPVLALILLLFAAPSAHIRTLYDLLCVVLIFPILVLAGASAQPWRSGQIYAFLGVTSYAIYALHDPLLSIVIQVVQALSHGGSHDTHRWTGAAFIVILLMIAYFVTVHYDTPVRNWLSHRKSAIARKS